MNKGSINLRNIKRAYSKRAHNAVAKIENLEKKTSGIIDKHIKKESLDPVLKRNIEFPRILLPQHNIPMSWWYFTGHLRGTGKNKEESLGFEYCIFKFHPDAFRIGFFPMHLIRKQPFLVGHFTITDKKRKRFIVKQSTGLMHKEHIRYDILDLQIGKEILRMNRLGKKFVLDSELMHLNIFPEKKLVKHFEDGFEEMYKKHRTYYVSFTRNKVKGHIKIGDRWIRTEGECWFDHQKCNLPEKTSLVGWNWFSMMFDDNTELMLFMIKDKRGISKKSAGGSFIDKEGNVAEIRPEEVNIRYTKTWTSKRTKTTYPIEWDISIPNIKLKVVVTATIPNQEVDSLKTTPATYWEGAMDIKGTKKGKRITGKGYTELFGYDKRIIMDIVRRSIY